MKLSELYESKVTEDWAKDQAVKNRAIITAKKDAEKIERDKIKAHNKLVDRQESKAQRTADRDAELSEIYNKVMQVIGEVFPDGDPIDRLSPWLRKRGIEGFEVGETIDAALKKFGHGNEKKGMSKYMADMWDDMSGDAMYDAKTMQAKGEEIESPFIEYDKAGIPKLIRNPWK